MRTVIILTVLLSIACEAMPPASIPTRIRESCVGDAERVLYLDSAFQDAELQLILDAVDDANQDLGSDVQVCGIVDDSVPEVFLIERGEPSSNRNTTGVYYWDRIVLYPEHTRGPDHLRKVFLHELGHMFGADHSTDHNDVMCQGWYGVSDYSRHDIEMINAAREM